MPHPIKTVHLKKKINNKALITTNHLCPIKQNCYNSLRYERKEKAFEVEVQKEITKTQSLLFAPKC